MADISGFLATLPTAGHLRSAVHNAERSLDILTKYQQWPLKNPNDEMKRCLNNHKQRAGHAPECAICMEKFSFKEVQLHPGMCCRRNRAVVCHPTTSMRKHIYHESCLASALRVMTKCPECREKLPVQYLDSILVRKLSDLSPIAANYTTSVLSASHSDQVGYSLAELFSLLRKRARLYTQGRLITDDIEYRPYHRMSSILCRRTSLRATRDTMNATTQTAKLWSWFFSNVTVASPDEDLDAFNHPLSIILFSFMIRLLDLAD